MFKFLSKFRSKVSCFSLSLSLSLPLSATCDGSDRDAEAGLEYLYVLDDNEPLDGAGLISDSNGPFSQLVT